MYWEGGRPRNPGRASWISLSVHLWSAGFQERGPWAGLQPGADPRPATPKSGKEFIGAVRLGGWCQWALSAGAIPLPCPLRTPCQDELLTPNATSGAWEEGGERRLGLGGGVGEGGGEGGGRAGGLEARRCLGEPQRTLHSLLPAWWVL